MAGHYLPFVYIKKGNTVFSFHRFMGGSIHLNFSGYILYRDILLIIRRLFYYLRVFHCCAFCCTFLPSCKEKPHSAYCSPFFMGWYFKNLPFALSIQQQAGLSVKSCE